MNRTTGPRVRGRRLLAAALGASVALGLLTPLLPAQASTGGAVTTSPVTAVLRPIMLDGTTSGQLSGRIDLPVALGDNGDYRLQGISAPDPDGTGNGLLEQSYPAGAVPGVISDPEDGEIDDEPGQGIEIGESSERIVRTPTGLRAETVLNDVVVDIEGLNDKAAIVLGVSNAVQVEQIRSVAQARVDGQILRSTAVTGLSVLGESIATPGGTLSEPVTRSHNRVVTDPIPLLRALGIDEEDIDQVESLISSARLELTLSVTVRPAPNGGLEVVAGIAGRAQAQAILGLGSADLRTGADTTILTAVFGATELATPQAVAPVVTSLAPAVAEPGTEVVLTGHGMVVDGTTVTVAGTNAPVVSVAEDGTAVTFRLPEGLSGGEYAVGVSTVGGTVDAGTVEVDADDTVPLRVTAITPDSGSDGVEVTVSGAGFVPGRTTAVVTDADGTRHRVGASRIAVAASRVSLTFSLPEGLALGAADVSIGVPGQSEASTAFTVLAQELPAVPVTGSAAVTGLQAMQTQVPLTVDNSSVMSWTAPTLLNPAGQAGPLTVLSVGNPALDTQGRGQQQLSEGGYTGTVTRDLDELRAAVEADGYALSLPAPWSSFFSPAGPVVTADSLHARAVARTDSSTATEVDLANLRVLGQPVVLDGSGRVAHAQEFSVAYNSDNLKSRQAMNNVFWSAAGGGYDRQKSETSATLWVTVEPVADAAAPGTVSAAAFRVVADLQYRYNGENGGFLSTRARHGSGGSRDGQRVRFFEAVVGQVSASSPDAVVPVLTAATPNVVEPGTAVTLTGRGFSASSVVVVAGQDVTPTSVAPDGTSLTFTVPEVSSGHQQVRVRTAGGTSNGRSLAVPGAPQIIEQPVSEVVGRVGQDLELGIVVDGVPEPTVRWQHLVDGDWIDLPGAEDAHHELRATEADHGRRFRAVVSNDRGTVVSSETTVRLRPHSRPSPRP
jgi:hypothetical protein